MVDIVMYDASTFFLRRCRSYGATVDTEALFGRHQRQRRRSKSDPFNETKKEILRERVAGSYKSVRTIARPEVKEPEVLSGAFAYFCHCWQK